MGTGISLLCHASIYRFSEQAAGASAELTNTTEAGDVDEKEYSKQCTLHGENSQPPAKRKRRKRNK